MTKEDEIKMKIYAGILFTVIIALFFTGACFASGQHAKDVKRKQERQEAIAEMQKGYGRNWGFYND